MRDLLAPETPLAMPLLRVDNLSVSLATPYGLLPAVREVSFVLEEGRVLCLVGESGCGKSMTALALLRLLPEAARDFRGQVSLRGTDLGALSERQMCRIRGREAAMVFQEPMTSLNPVMVVGDQVAEPLIRHQNLSREAARGRVIDLFRQVGIPAPERRFGDYPHQLSGGMRQRVMIAMALACDPRLLLADEPTTALDVTIQGQILRLLRQQMAERGMGLVLITHDLGVVAEMADSVGVMYAGRMVETAAVNALFSQPCHPYTQGLMGASPSYATRHLAKLQTVPGIVPTARELCGPLSEGCPFRPRCPKALPCCDRFPPEAVVGDEHRVACWLYVQ